MGDQDVDELPAGSTPPIYSGPVFNPMTADERARKSMLNYWDWGGCEHVVPQADRVISTPWSTPIRLEPVPIEPVSDIAILRARALVAGILSGRGPIKLARNLGSLPPKSAADGRKGRR